MALLSKSCVYGIRAAILMAIKGNADYMSIKDIANDLNLSAHFLTKILQQLTQEGLLISHRGPKGGVKFSRPSGEIKLIEIVAAIDGLELFEECALGLHGCGTATPCPLHEKWAEHKIVLRTLFETETLEKLAENVLDSGLRLRTLSQLDIIEFNNAKK
jgi:Rrf2 family transcriptional regulator, iron-sulfur cluster assembly transcription factor